MSPQPKRLACALTSAEGSSAAEGMQATELPDSVQST
jgi:hypothetical protein